METLGKRLLLICSLWRTNGVAGVEQTNVKLSHWNTGLVFTKLMNMHDGERYWTVCNPGRLSPVTQKRNAQALCKEAGFKKAQFFGNKEEYSEYMKTQGETVSDVYSDTTCLPNFGYTELSCEKGASSLEQCDKKLNWEHGGRCIHGRSELYLHCHTLKAKKVLKNGEGTWTEWEIMSSCYNEYQQRERTCDKDFCEGPWLEVTPCESCGKPPVVNEDYNDDYNYNNNSESSYGSDSYGVYSSSGPSDSSSYYDPESDDSDSYDDYGDPEPDPGIESRNSIPEPNKTEIIRKSRDESECSCQLITYNLLRKKNRYCYDDYTTWTNGFGESCQEIYAELTQKERRLRNHSDKKTNYNKCPQSGRCSWNIHYDDTSCDTFQVSYRRGFADAEEYNQRLNRHSWQRGSKSYRRSHHKDKIYRPGQNQTNLNPDEQWIGTYQKLHLAKFSDKAVYKLFGKHTYVIWVGNSWVFTGDLTSQMFKFKNEKGNPNCPALSDSTFWEYTELTCGTDLPQWKKIKDSENFSLTKSTEQRVSNCTESVRHALVFNLYSDVFNPTKRFDIHLTQRQIRRSLEYKNQLSMRVQKSPSNEEFNHLKRQFNHAICNVKDFMNSGFDIFTAKILDANWQNFKKNFFNPQFPTADRRNFSRRKNIINSP